jgi:hypothetical protein
MWNGRAPGSNGSVIWNGKGESSARVKSEASSEDVIQERKTRIPTQFVSLVPRMRGKKRVLPSSFGRVASYTCSICLEGLEDEEAAILPECTHRFHRRCMATWAGTCPECRKGEQVCKPPQPMLLGEGYNVTIRTDGEEGEGDSEDTSIKIDSSLPLAQAARALDGSVRDAILALPVDCEIRNGLRDASWYANLFRDHVHVRVRCDEYDDEYAKVTITKLTARVFGERDVFEEH